METVSEKTIDKENVTHQEKIEESIKDLRPITWEDDEVDENTSNPHIR